MGKFGAPWPIEALNPRFHAQVAAQIRPAPVEAPESTQPATTTHPTPSKPRQRSRTASGTPSNGSTHARKARVVDRTPSPQPEPSPVHAPHEPAQVEALYPDRVLVCVESRRCGVQCDPDNILVKWHIDALRYARILSDDTCAAIDLRVTETRVPTRKEEGVRITITPIR